MPTDPSIETRIAFEGPFPLALVLLLGVVLVAVAILQARRDARPVDRPRFIAILSTLRIVAIAVALWMLAGPTRVTVTRLSKPKSVAIFVDHSASMGLVDLNDGSGNLSRWAAARDRGPLARPLLELDAALATLLASQNQLHRFAAIPSATAEAQAARDLLQHALEGIDSALTPLRRQASSLASLPTTPPSFLGALTEIIRTIDSGPLAVLKARSAEFNRGKSLAALERPSWLPDQLTRLASALDALDQQLLLFAQSVESNPSPTATALPPTESRLSRLDKVTEYLAAAENGWLKELRAKANVRRFDFGDRLLPRGTTPWSPPDAPNPGASPSTAAPASPNSDLSPNVPPAPLSASTHLGAPFHQMALENAAQPLAAAIVFTDGGHNAGIDPREIAPSLGRTPLHLVPIGNSRLQRDVILHHTHAPKAVLQNDQLVVDAVVTAYDCSGETIELQLLAGSTIVDRTSLKVAQETVDSRVQLRWKAAQLGRQTFTLRAVPLTDERSLENNTELLSVQVMEDNIRVLVADNFPRWETRYLINLFKRDDRVAFDQLLFEPQLTRGPGVRTAFPVSTADWARYRVAILGDVLPSQLTPAHQTALVDWVRNGGGNVILIAGPDAMPGAYLDQPLASLLPVEPGDRPLPNDQPLYLHLADEGSLTLATQVADTPERSEQAWSDMTQRLPLYALSPFSKPRPTTHSLVWASPSKSAYRPGDPATRTFLGWHFVGAGRVVYLSAPVTYQLRYRQGDTFHHRFWGQLLRWTIARDLAEGSRTVRIATDKSRYEHGDPAEVTVRLAQLDGQPVPGAALQLGASQDGRLLQALPLHEDSARPGTYRGILQQLPVGPVKLDVSGPALKPLLASENVTRPIESIIHIDPSGQLELRQPLCNLPLLRELADATDGLLLPPTGLEAALHRLSLDPDTSETTSKLPLWNRWDLLWIFIVCLSLEWAGRKYLGLS